MTSHGQYNKWMESPAVDEKTKKELLSIAGNEEEIRERFSGMPAFGTAGMRGILGAGLSRINPYTVRYATQGLADLVRSCGENCPARGVVIAYDCRRMSSEMAWAAAGVLAGNGIRAHIFDELRPTPELSFAVRHLGAIAGINITASHNPKEYNGYKVYWEDGAQFSPERVDAVLAAMARRDIFDVDVMEKDAALEKGLIQVIGSEVDKAYTARVLAEAVDPGAVRRAADRFTVVYTPFHGAGYRLVPQVLRELGVRRLFCVPEQMVIDGAFPTVKSPNPENPESFELAVRLARREKADLIVGTDPDSDRVGAIVRDRSGEYLPLTGNQMGVLLLDYIIKGLKRKGALPPDAMTVKTIVSTEMAAAVARKHGVTIQNVLTGFKYIGEKIKEAEETGEGTFIFGFEESYGYLKGTYARDKDGVVASMLLAEMACHYFLEGKTLLDAMEGLYEEYGFYCEHVVSIMMEGAGGLEKMERTMAALREKMPADIEGIPVRAVRDYQAGTVFDLATGQKKQTGLPKSDVVFFELGDGSSFVVRPSGTEPKIKCYMLVGGRDQDETGGKCRALEKFVRDIIP